MAKPRIAFPETVRKGEVFEVKTLISHPMETGFRVDGVGKVIPRNIMTSFICRYNGTEIFRMDLNPGVAANPYISFFTVATESGALEFLWTDQNGVTIKETKSIQVAAP